MDLVDYTLALLFSYCNYFRFTRAYIAASSHYHCLGYLASDGLSEFSDVYKIHGNICQHG